MAERQIAAGEYLVFVDHRFGGMAKKELTQAFPGSAFRAYRVRGKTALLIGSMEGNDVLDAIEEKAYSFVDFALRVDEVVASGGDNAAVCDAMERALRKLDGRTFRIEAKKVHGKMEESAKSIEVRLGKELEARGFRADLKEPAVMLYAVFLGGKALIGHMEASRSRNRTIDLLRKSSKESAEKVNRSELKMKEAIAFFGINASKLGTCLDIGAAPGGWTHCLSQGGARVVAVDYALLDYGLLARGKRILVLANEEEVEKLKGIVSGLGLGKSVDVRHAGDSGNTASYDIIHVKATLKKDNLMTLLRSMGRFGMLAIDINTGPDESAGIANSLSALMDPGAQLVMTIKLVTRPFAEHVKTAETELAKSYTGIRMKKLPHNREELTAYAVLKGV